MTEFPAAYPSARPSSFTRFWGAFLGLLLMTAGCVFTWLLWRNYQKARAVHQWKPTPCLVVESRVEEHRFSPRSAMSYIPRVRYRYHVAGQMVESNQLRVVEHRSGKRAGIDQIIRDFPAGKEAQCWVDPAQREQAVLQLPSKAAGYSLWFPLLFVVGGAGMIRGSLRSKNPFRIL